MVDDADFAFRDANVPGAVTRGRAHGGLDILFPALTKFRGFDLDLATLDLRTIRFLYPNFARLGGTVAGRATLDSSWLDVRFRNADLTHTDGPGIPTHVTGSGRITNGTKIVYDADLQASPLSFTMLARSYPIIPFRGPYTGPVRVQGTIDTLLLVTTLSGDGGTVAYSGYVDADSVGGYATHGVVRVERVGDEAIGKMPFSMSGPGMTEHGSHGKEVHIPHGMRRVGVDITLAAPAGGDGLRLRPRDFRLVAGRGRPIAPAGADVTRHLIPAGTSLSSNFAYNVPRRARRLELRIRGAERPIALTLGAPPPSAHDGHHH
jgi:hypothetical protein